MALQALEAAKPEFEKYRASLVTILPQAPPTSRKSVCQNKVTFPMLSDTNSEVAAAFGLHLRLPNHLIELYELIDIYKWLKNEPPAVNDRPSWTLLMPARYVISPDRTILCADLNPDYGRRPGPDDLIRTLEQVATET